jgi:hypothetical protein
MVTTVILPAVRLLPAPTASCSSELDTEHDLVVVGGGISGLAH